LRASRGVETKHRANLSGTQGGHQAIEAGAFDGTTCGAAKIDYLNIGEARRRATSTNSYWRLWLSRFN
jgi:hypothetical protein